jgi:hypothetical protein
MQSVSPDIGQSVLNGLQCPACKEYMEPPITFCQGGHNICSNCRPTVSSCPTCKQGFLEIRNIILENLSLQMKFPCRYSKYGCKDTFPHSAIREHKAKCGYRPQICPVDYLMLKGKCSWTGTAEDVKQHLQTAHARLCGEYKRAHLIFLSSSNAPTKRNKFLFAYDEVFCYCLRIQRERMYVVLHYIGPAKNDMKYRYEVKLMNTESKESVVFTLIARSFTENQGKLFFPKNYIKLHRDVTDRFRDEKDELVVSMKILKVDE